jgi:LPXTG-motif cell wall-anchored protein
LGKGDAVFDCCVGDLRNTEDGSRRASTCVCGATAERFAAVGWNRRRMMYLARRISGAALAITMFGALVLALSAGAEAQEDQIMEVSLTQSRDSGVSGTATLEEVEGGVQVTLQMQNLPETGIKHINHIHAGGTCADDRAGRTAPVTIPLETITAQDDGTGSATTTIEDVSVDQLFGEDKERFVLLHAETIEGEGVPPGIACADLAPLPDTGGIRPATLSLAGAISVLGVAAGLFILQRRIGAEN